MKFGALTVAVALTLAGVATLTVFLYVQGLEDDKVAVASVEVVVAKEDILAGTDLDDLISEGAFTTKEVSEDTVVEGAITSLSQLEGREATVPILAGEQIAEARLSGSRDLPGGTLGIPQGHEAVAIPLDASRLAGGSVRTGDHVRILATFSKGQKGEPVTVALVPDVLVLEVSGEEDTGIAAGNEDIVTLAVKARDAQRVVFAMEEGSVWLSLLPPDEEGAKASPLGFPQVVK